MSFARIEKLLQSLASRITPSVKQSAGPISITRSVAFRSLTHTANTSKSSYHRRNLFSHISRKYDLRIFTIATTLGIIALNNTTPSPLPGKHHQKSLLWEDLEVIAAAFSLSLPQIKDDKTFAPFKQLCFKAIFSACLKDDWAQIEQVKELLPTLRDHRGRTIFHAAIEEAPKKCIQELIDRKLAVYIADANGNNGLHIAASCGHPQLIEPLLGLYSHDSKNNDGATALHLAVLNNHPRVIEALVQLGANSGLPLTEDVDEEKVSFVPLALAIRHARRGKPHCIDALQPKKADFVQNIGPIGTVIHLAIRYNQLDILKHLFSHVEYKKIIASILEKEDDQGLTPLSLACSLGNLEIMDFLRSQNAQLQSISSKNEYQPIHWACLAEQPDAVEFLWKYGANLEAQDSTPKKGRPRDLLKGRASDAANECRARLDNLPLLSQAEREKPINFRRTPPENLVFEGGGPRGLVYVGALKRMRDKGLLKEVRRVAGTSAGAITATLLAIGYTPDELEDILIESDLAKFLDTKGPLHKKLLEIAKDEELKSSDKLTEVLKTLIKEYWEGGAAVTNPVQRAKKLFNELSQISGLCDGEDFRKWLERLIAEKISEKTGKTLEESKYLTFGELHKLAQQNRATFKDLHVFALALDKNSPTEITRFNSEDKRWKHLIISEAVRSSMSIPAVFEPHILHYKDPHTKNPISRPDLGRFIDGGLIKNAAWDAFDENKYQSHPEIRGGRTNRRTLGLSVNLTTPPTPILEKEIGLLDLVQAVGYTFYSAESSLISEQSVDADRVIRIDPKGVKLLDLDLSLEKKRELIRSGERAVDKSFPVEDITSIRHLSPLETKWVPLISPHPDYVERYACLEQLEKAFVKSSPSPQSPAVIRVLWGLGGMGKSEMAINFAATHLGDFPLIWTFNCADKTLLFKSFERLAEILWDYKRDPENREDLEGLRRKVYRYLGENYDKAPLLIFDGLEKIDDPEEELPQRGACVLITARIKDVLRNQHSLIHIPPFTLKEAEQLVEKITKQPISPEMTKLAEEFRDFPFVLNQVAHFIRETECTIAEYLEVYDTGRDPFAVGATQDQRYQHSLLQVWKITYDSLRKTNPDACTWLHLCAYLNTSPIPERWLNSWLEKRYGKSAPTKRLETIRVLQNYGLVRKGALEKEFSVHRRLQDVMQAFLKSTKEGNLFFDQVFELVSSMENSIELGRPGYTEIVETWVAHACQVLVNYPRMYGNKAPYKVAVLLNNVGSVLQDLTRLDESLDYCMQALEMRRQVYGEKPSDKVATSLNNVGSVLQDLTRLEESLDYSMQALEMRRQVYGEKPSDSVATSLNNVGSVLQDLTRLEESLNYSMQALEMWRQVYGEKPSDSVAISLNNVGSVLQNLTRLEESLDYSMQALEMWRQVYGEKPSDKVATSLNNVGSVLQDLTRLEESLDYSMQALEMWRQVYGEKPSDSVAISLNNVGLILQDLTRLEESLNYSMQALEMRRQVYGEKPSDKVATSLNNVGRVLQDLTRLEESLNYSMQGLEMRRQVYGEKPSDKVAISLNNVGSVLRDFTRLEESLDYSMQALEMKQQIYGEKPSNKVAISLNNVGRVLMSLRRHDEAEKHLQQALDMYRELYKNDSHRDIVSTKKFLDENRRKQSQWCTIV